MRRIKNLSAVLTRRRKVNRLFHSAFGDRFEGSVKHNGLNLHPDHINTKIRYRLNPIPKKMLCLQFNEIDEQLFEIIKRDKTLRNIFMDCNFVPVAILLLSIVTEKKQSL